MAELLTERWTLIVASLWLVMVSGIGWRWQQLPLVLCIPGIVFAWGLGFLHNWGILPDSGYG